MRSKNTGELTMSHLYLLGVATLTLTSASFAGSDTNADLQARLEAAEARISELSAATNANWLNDTRADEIRGLVHDVLADADTRASLQGSGSTAAYNDGFTIGSADGNWSMKINGLVQTRWYSNTISEDAGGVADIDTSGFETARAAMDFSGTIAGDYSYAMRLNWTNTTIANNPSATDHIAWAYGGWELQDGWTLSAGRMKAHTTREWIINAEDQMAIERSITSGASGALGGGGVTTTGITMTGVAIDYAQDDFRVHGAYGNGLTEPAPNAAYTANDNSHMWNVRGELLLEGNWGQFDQFTSPEGNTNGTLLGVAYWDTSLGDTVPNTASQSGWVFDGQMQWDGSNLYASYSNISTVGQPAEPNALVLAYGIYLDSDWEAYARWTQVDLDQAGTNDSEIMTVGINYYMAGNNAKWSLDYSWCDEAMTADAQSGWQLSAGTQDQEMLRMQLQLSF